MTPRRLILFDIDGSILKFKEYKSAPIFAKTLGEIFGVDFFTPRNLDFSGKTDLEILCEMAELNGIDERKIFENSKAIFDSLFEKFKKETKPQNMVLLPGVVQFLDKLESEKSFALGLLTGNFKKNAYLKLNVFNLGKRFLFGAFGDDSRYRNELPPIAVKRANELFGKETFKLKDCLIIGDSVRDIRCAKSNNIPVISVATGKEKEETLRAESPDLLAKDLTDANFIVEWIKKL